MIDRRPTGERILRVYTGAVGWTLRVARDQMCITDRSPNTRAPGFAHLGCDLPTTRPCRWLGVAVAGKLLYLLLFVRLLQADGVLQRGAWIHVHGDSTSYLHPAENLITQGRYTYDLTRPEAQAGRMPGYALVYVPLHLVLSPSNALNACAVLQAIMDGVSVYCLAAIGYVLTQSRAVFLTTFILSLLSTHVTSWNHRALSESWATTSAVVATFLLIAGMRRPRGGVFLLAGALSAWSIFLKSVFVLLLPWMAAAVALFLRQAHRLSVKRVCSLVSLYLLPFAMADGAWLWRNYMLFGRLIPLQFNAEAGYEYTNSFRALKRFVQAWGGDIVAWNPKAEIRWFDETAGMCVGIHQLGTTPA